MELDGSLGQPLPLRKGPISVPPNLDSWPRPSPSSPQSRVACPSGPADFLEQLELGSPPYLGLQVTLGPSPPCQGLGGELSFAPSVQQRLNRGWGPWARRVVFPLPGAPRLIARGMDGSTGCGHVRGGVAWGVIGPPQGHRAGMLLEGGHMC